MLQHVVHLLVANLVVFVMLAVGLQTRAGTIRTSLKARPRLFEKALLVLYVGIPLLTIVLAKLFSLPPRTAALLVLFGACPAAPLVVRRLAKQSERAGSTAISLVAIASLLAPLLVPGWLLIIDRVFESDAFHATPATLFGVVVTKTLLPLLVGVVIRSVAPQIAAPLAKVFTGLGAVALVILVVALLKASFEVVGHLPVGAGAALLLTAIGSAALGEAAGGPDLDDREAVATVAMTGSPALALAVIHTSFPGLTGVAGLVGTFIILRLLASLPYRIFAARRRNRQHLHDTAAVQT